MRVLHLISSGGMYGAEAVILELVRTLNPGPHHGMIGVFSNPTLPVPELHKVAVEHGFESHRVKCRGTFDLSVLKTIRLLVKRTGATVVHAHGYKADVYVSLALRGSGTPILSTCHTWYDNDLPLRLYGMLDRWVLRDFTAVVAVSEEVRRRLLRSAVRSDKINFIRNGVDLDRFRPKSAPKLHLPLRVGLVGRLAPEKGIDLFIHAAAGVLKEMPDTQFIVCGEGPERASLEGMIKTLGVDGNVQLQGATTSMPTFYNSIDLLVSSSRQEGLPVALLEGMASGCAVVATEVGEVKQLIQNGRTGLLVAPGDPRALQDAMIAMLKSDEQRSTYGLAARALVEEQFSSAQMSSHYLDLYEKVVKFGRNALPTPESTEWVISGKA